MSYYYYSLSGFLASCHLMVRPTVNPASTTCLLSVLLYTHRHLTSIHLTHGIVTFPPLLLLSSLLSFFSSSLFFSNIFSFFYFLSFFSPFTLPSSLINLIKHIYPLPLSKEFQSFVIINVNITVFSFL